MGAPDEHRASPIRRAGKTGGKRPHPCDEHAASGWTSDLAFERASHWIEGLPPVGRLAIPAAVFLVIAIGDVAGPGEIPAALFYLFPVTFAAWFVSARAGYVFAILSTMVWTYIDPASWMRPGWFVLAWTVAMRLGFYSAVVVLASHLRWATNQEEQLSHTDSLTGVGNQRAFAEAGENALARMHRNGLPLTVGYADLDDFKAVNDRYGHREGDAVLRAFARSLDSCVRATDLVARIGGDEFVVLFPETDSVEAELATARMQRCVERDVTRPWSVGFTMGVITYLSSPASIDDVLGEVDSLMYEGKRSGRGRIVQRIHP